MAMVFLFIPLFQNLFEFKKNIKELKGAYTPAKDTCFTVESWFSGRYKDIKEEYATQNFGLRNYYVMLTNQIRYKFFDIANIKKVVVGKGDFLYETDYIDAYYGNNFIGINNLIDRYKKLKSVQEYLAAIGIDLEVVFLPSKASFYPEFIPDRYASVKKVSNYDCAVKLCKKLNIDFIDFSSWFITMKDYIPYDLYPKTGIHWSNYGALLATDSLKKHIEYNTHLNLRSFNITNVSFSDSIINPDNDMGEVMNLLFPIKTLPMPYASYYWKDEDTDVKPKTLTIADSYYWNIYNQGLANNLFGESNYWYYNQTVYPEDQPERDVKKLNLYDEIRKYQVIILMATEINVHDIGWGFVEQTYDLFKNEIKNTARQKMYLVVLKEAIRNTPEWLKNIELKAKEKKISREEMMNLDAEYIYKTDYCKPEVIAATEEIKVRIHNTPQWMKDIAKKAKEKHITFDEMLELDAKYIYEMEKEQK
jgi:hypothetical protein